MCRNEPRKEQIFKFQLQSVSKRKDKTGLNGAVQEKLINSAATLRYTDRSVAATLPYTLAIIKKHLYIQ